MVLKLIEVKEIKENLESERKKIDEILNSETKILGQKSPGVWRVECKICSKEFITKQNNRKCMPKICDECRSSKGTCCNCSKSISFGRVFCDECKELVKSTSIYRHDIQAQKIAGNNNPAKRQEVKEKIVNQMKIRQKELGGLKSKFEVEVKNLLDGLNVDYEYDVPIIIDKTPVRPDFVISFDGKDTIAIVVAGWIWDDKKEQHLKRYVDQINLLLKEFRYVVIVTYKEYSNYFSNLYEDNVYVTVIEDPFEDKGKAVIVKENIFNVDYSHFLYFHDAACKRFHGHMSSSIGLVVEGYMIKDMVIDFGDMKRIAKEVVGQIDHKLIVNRKHIKEIAGDMAAIEYFTDSYHRLELPINELFIMDAEPTLENISSYFADEILKQMPANVSGIGLIMREGLDNESICFTDRYVLKFNKLGELINSLKTVKVNGEIGEGVAEMEEEQNG